MSLEENLGKLNPNNYEDSKSVELINLWKERVPLLSAKLDFKNHPITSEIAGLTVQEIERIKAILVNNETITELERRVLQREKKLHEFYLSLFTYDPSGELEAIEKAVELEVAEEE